MPTTDIVPYYSKLPTSWKMVDSASDGHKWINKSEGISVIISIATQPDLKKWLHISLARPNRMPDYHDIKNVKTLFLPNRKAIMVFPEDDKFVNIHPYCLHLFHCLDGDGLPEFSGFRADVGNGETRTL